MMFRCSSSSLPLDFGHFFNSALKRFNNLQVFQHIEMHLIRQLLQRLGVRGHQYLKSICRLEPVISDAFCTLHFKDLSVLVKTFVMVKVGTLWRSEYQK